MFDKEQFSGDDISFKKLFVPLTNTKVLILFVIAGVLIYGRSLFNGFVWDDLPFIIKNTQIHQFDIGVLLGNNMFNNGPFYRPIPAIYFSSLYSLFQQSAFFYHAIQLMLHIAGTFLLYIFFRTFFTNIISFVLALVFLIHPINVESVAYIGSTQSQLYFIPGIIALILNQKKHLTKLRIFSIASLLFVCAMTKEVGFLYFLLVIGYRYIFQLGSKAGLIIASVAAVGLYAVFRLLVGEVTYEMSEVIPIAGLSFFERLLNIPAIIFYYLKTLFFPLQLGVWQIWIVKDVNFYDFLLPLFVSTFFFLILGMFAYVLFRKLKNNHAQDHFKSKANNDKVMHGVFFAQFVFFLFWFVIGIGLLLQFVPLDMTVADRWFYFPIVGALGMIGVFVTFILSSKTYFKKILVWAAIIVICLLSIRTLVRILDWHDNITLFSRDIKFQQDNFFLVSNLGEHLTNAGRHDEAKSYLERAHEMHPKPGFLNNLGMIYQGKKQYKKALAYFSQAIDLSKKIEYEDNKVLALYINNAFTLLLDGRPDESREFLQNTALVEFPENVHLNTILAIAHSQTNNQQKALETITRAYEKSKNRITADVYYKITNNIPVNIENRERVL